jgi:hypothetical protein
MREGKRRAQREKNFGKKFESTQNFKKKRGEEERRSCEPES